MKKLIFSLLLFVVVAYPNLIAQSFECTHTLTPDQRNELADEQNNSETRDATCFDDEWTGENQTYKIVLEYSTVYTDPDYMTSLVTVMRTFYEQYGITLDILILPNDLDLINPELDGWVVNSIDDCITGKIVREPDSNGGAGNANGQTGSNFWVKDDPSPNGAIHELGHVLGLFHTQGPPSASTVFDINNNMNNEIILFDEDVDGVSEYTECDECNCLTRGDRVCDTPVDPIVYANESSEVSPEEAIDWRDAMFDYDATPPQIVNSDNEMDQCGANYANMSPEDQYKVFNNVMGQHANFLDTDINPFLSWGQVERIKTNNIGRPWTIDGEGGMMVACEGFTVDSPMVIDTDKLITSDVIVNDKLTILNANVKFSAGVEIVINEGAELILNNSNLDSDACVSGGFWSGINVVGNNETSRITLNNSIIKGIEESAITCNGAELFLNIDNASQILCDNRNVIEANSSNLAMQMNITSETTGFVGLDGNINLNNINGWFHANNTVFSGGDILISNMNTKLDDCQINSSLTINNSIGFYNASILNSEIQQPVTIENLNGLLTIRNNQMGSGITKKITVINVNDLDIGDNFISTFGTGQFASTGYLELKNETPNDNQNVIVENNFSGCPEAILISEQSNDGLYLNCNTFSVFGNPSAIDVSIQSGSIAEVQGGPELAAGNIFSSGTTNIFGHDGASVNYFYQNDIPNQNPNVDGDEIEKTPVLDGSQSKCDFTYPYLPYPSHCYDDAQNANETGVDCGGACGPCIDPTLVTAGPPLIGPDYTNCNNNGVQDGNETGVDCGGNTCPPCGPMLVASCYNGVQDSNETGVDCGGSCDPCVFTYGDDGPINNQNQQAIQQSETDFVTMVSDIYGTDIIELGNDIDINEDIQQLNALLDNGNTEQLVNYIDNNSATNAAVVINELNTISPYVSATAVHSLFNHIDNYTDTDLFNIIKNNPGLLDDSYIRYMVHQSGRLSTSQIDQIKATNRITNDRTTLQDKIRIKRMYMYTLIRERISLEMSGHNPNWGAIRAQLLKKDHRDALYQIYETFISERNYSFATQYLDIIDAEDIQIPFYKSQLNSFKELNQILVQYYYGDNRTTSIPSSVQDQLYIWANSCYGKTTIKAKAVLKELFGVIVSSNNCNPYQTIDKPQNRTAPLVTPSIISDALFTLSPNPATNSIHISTDIEINSDDVYILVIYNTLGNRIVELKMESYSTGVDLTNFRAGVYMYQISKNKKLIQSNKFIKIN